MLAFSFSLFRGAGEARKVDQTTCLFSILRSTSMPNKKASLDTVTSSDNQLARRKKNSEAQAAFRDKRNRYILSLEQTRLLHFLLWGSGLTRLTLSCLVTQLEKTLLEHQDQSRVVRAEVQVQQQQNARLRFAIMTQENAWKTFFVSGAPGNGPAGVGVELLVPLDLLEEPKDALESVLEAAPYSFCGSPLLASQSEPGTEQEHSTPLVGTSTSHLGGSSKNGSSSRDLTDSDSQVLSAASRKRRRADSPPRSPSPSFPSIADSVAVIKAQCFGAVRRPRAKTKTENPESSAVATEALEVRGLGIGAKRPRMGGEELSMTI